MSSKLIKVQNNKLSIDLHNLRTYMPVVYFCFVHNLHGFVAALVQFMHKSKPEE